MLAIAGQTADFFFKIRFFKNYTGNTGHLSYLYSKERNKFTVAGNHECKETDRINSVQSSLKSQSIVGNPVGQKKS